MSKENQIFYTKTFENTSAEKQKKVLDVAVKEFAEKGYHNTSVNIIAKEAQISVGALYKYFKNKEDLYLSVVSRESEILDEIMSEIHSERDMFSQIEEMFHLSAKYGLQYCMLSQINLELATRPMAQLAERLSGLLESSMSDYLIELIRKNKEDGVISSSVDERVTAFCIDNLLIMYQLSHSSSYFKRRLKLYLGDTALNEEDVIKKMMVFVRGQM